MRYTQIILKSALFAGLLLFCRPAAQGAPLFSDNGVFFVDIPGSWVQDVSDNRAIVMLATSGRKKVTISIPRSIQGEASEKEIKIAIQGIREAYGKQGIQTSRIYNFRTKSGGRLYFTQYVSGGTKGQAAFFNFAGQVYAMETSGLADPEFQAIPKTLTAQQAAPPVAAGAREEAAPPGLPAAQPGAADTVAGLPPPPAGGGGEPAQGLGAPPAETAYGAEETPGRPAELPPLPKRQVGGALSLFFALALISAAVLGYRAVVKREIEAPGEPPPPGAVLPFRAEKDYRAFPLAFDVADASGQWYRAVSPRWPSLLLGSGIILYFLLTVTVQGMDFAGLDLRAIPISLVMGLSGLLTLSNFLIVTGALLFLFFRKKLKVYDPSGGLMLDITQKRVTFASLFFFIRDEEGNDVAGLRRKGFAIIRRHWELVDPEGNVIVNIREDSAGKAIARKFLGHLWGLLRTNYIIYGEKGEIGAIRRDWSVWNRYRLHLDPPANLDPRLAMAAAVMIDVVDPDRWYPWYG